MTSPEDSADIVRRLVALERIPMFSGVQPVVLTGIAEHAVDLPLKAGELVPSRADAVVFLPCRANPTGSTSPRVTDHAPGLIARLAGVELDGQTRAQHDGLAIEVSFPRFMALLEDDFSLFLGVSAAIARDALDGAIAGAEPIPDVLELRGGAAEVCTDIVDRVVHLQSALPFARGRVGSLFQLARHAAKIQANDGTELWRQGDSTSLTVFPIRGAIRARLHGGDALGIEPGTVLPVAAALARCPRRFTGVAEGDFVGLTLPVELFLDVLEDEPELASEVLHALARTVITSTARPSSRRATAHG